MGYGMDTGFPNGNGMSGNLDQAVWATDEEYRVWNGSGSFENLGNLSFNNEQFQGRSGNEGPNKKLRVSQQAADFQNNRAKAVGKMFFKTKLCCKFRAGTCPYVTNCNFAHSLEELRKPPPNWQDIVAAHDGEKKALEPREEFQIPSVVSADFNGDGARSSKGRHCKKFYTEEGCPYGDSCAYVHDEHSRARESVAITLNTGPPPSSNNYVVVANGGAQNVKAINWKTRLCNKWEMTGFCPFGSKCFFAHGIAELNQFIGASATPDAKVSNLAQPDSTPSKTPGDRSGVSSTSAPNADMYKSGAPLQKPSCAVQGLTPRVHQKWKGPDKISRIYGDWIEEAE